MQPDNAGYTLLSANLKAVYQSTEIGQMPVWQWLPPPTQPSGEFNRCFIHHSIDSQVI